eukprot:4884757-Pyramimonas_sp.AAC.1
MERYKELHGARGPSDEMKASMHAIFDQIRQVPGLEYATQWHELSTDHPGTGVRAYQWLLLQVESPMMRGREQRAISEHESTLNSGNRQARLTGGMNEGGGGGRRASAVAATAHRLGLPTDKTASGRIKRRDSLQICTAKKELPRSRARLPL